ncbi:MAG: thioredoxin [Methanobacteriota archaeon]
MHKPVDITDGEFEAFVKKHPVVLVDFWAPWCGPCKRVAPVLDELASELEGKVTFAKVNTDENPKTAMKFGVMSIPTLLVFKNGALADTIVGAWPKPKIAEHLARVA